MTVFVPMVNPNVDACFMFVGQWISEDYDDMVDWIADNDPMEGDYQGVYVDDFEMDQWVINAPTSEHVTDVVSESDLYHWGSVYRMTAPAGFDYVLVDTTNAAYLYVQVTSTSGQMPTTECGLSYDQLSGSQVFAPLVVTSRAAELLGDQASRLSADQDLVYLEDVLAHMASNYPERVQVMVDAINARTDGGVVVSVDSVFSDFEYATVSDLRVLLDDPELVVSDW